MNITQSSEEDKINLMPDVIFLLNIVDATKLYGINNTVVNQLIAYNDDFLSLGYSMIASGIEPAVFEHAMKNFIDGENDLFSKLKKSIQVEAMLAMQQGFNLTLTAMLIFSKFGMNFKKQYIEAIKKLDNSLYEKIFTDCEFSGLDIRLFIRCDERDFYS